MLEYKLAFLGEGVLVIQGVIFVACVLLFRRGILGAIASRLHIKL
jgi:branched-chain amino acid transport system permease protein